MWPSSLRGPSAGSPGPALNPLTDPVFDYNDQPNGVSTEAPGIGTGMVVVINGEPREIPAGQTIAALVAALGLEPAQVAVELEREIVRRADWAGRVLAAGARLEIVHFVGGG